MARSAPRRPAALDALTAHRDAVVRTLERRFGSREAAEDAVQEALVAAVVLLDRGGAPPANPKAWLHLVAHRRAIDGLRDAPAQLPAEPPLGATGADPAELAVLHERVAEVLAGIADLPARQRRALAMQTLEGATLADIAADVGGDPGSAKALVSRARATLRTRLASRSMPCAEVRDLVASAARRGVRAPHAVHRHLDGCADCARYHARLRRRPRGMPILALPVTIWTALTARLWPDGTGVRIGLALRDAADSGLAMLGAKGCAAACALAVGAAAAPPLADPPGRDRGATIAGAPAEREERPEPGTRRAFAPPPRAVPVAQSAPTPSAPTRRASGERRRGNADEARSRRRRPAQPKLTPTPQARQARAVLAAALTQCYTARSQRCQRRAERQARAAGLRREDVWASRRQAAEAAGLQPGPNHPPAADRSDRPTSTATAPTEPSAATGPSPTTSAPTTSAPVAPGTAPVAPSSAPSTAPSTAPSAPSTATGPSPTTTPPPTDTPTTGPATTSP